MRQASARPSPCSGRATGGPAANVAAWVAALGGRSRRIAARATDPAALLVAGDLAGRGVDLVGPVIAGRTGVVVSLSDGGSHRSMLTDRGVGPELTAQEVRPEWLDGCSWLHLPAYSLTSLIGSLIEGDVFRQAIIEPGIVMLVIWGAAFWLR